METVIVFSNNKMLNRKFKLSVEVEQEVDGQNKICESKMVTNEKYFLFAFDELTKKDLTKLTENISEGDVYILHHTTPSKKTLTCFKEKLNDKGINDDHLRTKESTHNDSNTYGLLKKLSGKLDNEDDESIKKCEEVFENLKKQIVTIPSLIQLHKRLILEKLDGKSISEDMLCKLKNESEDFKVAIDAIPEDKKIYEKEVLFDYISDWVVKYGT